MKKYIVTASNLNLRTEPKITADVILILTKDEEVELLSVSGDGYWYKVKANDGQTGWAAHKFLVYKEENDQIGITDGDFPWLKVAAREIGQKEYTGADNLRIVEFLRSTSLPASQMNDETAWCSAFVNWCMEKAGYEGTDSAWARSWLKWGVELETPKRGCVTVFSRDANSGHVALFLREVEDTIEVLGGNQHDCVCVSRYPKSRLLGYRLPR